jgi:hypothetical protein
MLDVKSEPSLFGYIAIFPLFSRLQSEHIAGLTTYRAARCPREHAVTPS